MLARSFSWSASQDGGKVLCGGADALERSMQRVPRAAVGADAVDRDASVRQVELFAEKVGHGFGFRFAGGEVGPIAREVQQRVRGLVHQGRELDVWREALRAGSACLPMANVN
jgi:hypothetical protein